MTRAREARRARARRRRRIRTALVYLGWIVIGLAGGVGIVEWGNL